MVDTKKRRKQPRVQPLPCLRYLNSWLLLDKETGALYHKRDGHGYRKGDRADYVTARGYRRVSLYYAGKSHNFAAHRIVYALANQVEVPTHLHIDHDNRDRGCNVPTNLILKPPQQNYWNRGCQKKLAA